MQCFINTGTSLSLEMYGQHKDSSELNNKKFMLRHKKGENMRWSWEKSLKKKNNQKRKNNE